MVIEMLKVALWQSVEKTQSKEDIIFTVSRYFTSLFFIVGLNFIISELSINLYLALLLRLLVIVLFSYVWPAHEIVSEKGLEYLSIFFLRPGKSIVGLVISPFLVYSYLKNK